MCKALHQGHSNPNARHTHRLGREVIESSCVEKDLRVMVDGNLNMTWQCGLSKKPAKFWASSKAAWLAGQRR